MKRISIVAVFITGMSFASASLAQECLRRASNRDLVAELESRLSGSGPGSQDSSSVLYLCEQGGDMNISVINSAGVEKKLEVDIDKQGDCTEMSNTLSHNRSRITATTLIGVCDYSGDLQKISITPQGSITLLGEIDMGDLASCIQQANSMNGSGHRPFRGAPVSRTAVQK